MATKKKRRRSDRPPSLEKFSEEERREHEAGHPPVEREHFEEVLRRLTVPKRRGGV
jgi:hypothetical protein